MDRHSTLLVYDYTIFLLGDSNRKLLKRIRNKISTNKYVKLVNLSKTGSRGSLVARENSLLASVYSIERECNLKIQLQNELVQSLSDAKSLNNEKLKANQLTNTQKQILLAQTEFFHLDSHNS